MNPALLLLPALLVTAVTATVPVSARALRSDLGPRVRRTSRVDELVDRMGRPGAALVVAGVGVVAMLVVFVLLGQALRVGPVAELDRAVHDWIAMHQVAWAVDATQFATDLGSWELRWWIAPIAAVVLGVRYRHAWWVPTLSIALLFLLERGVQKYVGMFTKRPLVEGLAPYPSGGTGRVLSMAGLLWFLWLQTSPQTSRRARVTGWVVVVALGVFEGWTRLYLNVHWVTDVPPGLAFGAAALLVTLAVLRCLPGPTPHARARSAAVPVRPSRPASDPS